MQICFFGFLVLFFVCFYTQTSSGALLADGVGVKSAISSFIFEILLSLDGGDKRFESGRYAHLQ